MENYGGARPKTTQRVTIRSPQVEAVPASHTRQDQEIGTCAALLRYEVFIIVPSTVNVTQGRAQAKKVDSNEDGEAYNTQRLPQVPGTLVARGGVSSVNFKEPVVKETVVSSTPCMRLHPAAVNLSGFSSPETSDKETEDQVVDTISHD